MGDFTVSISKQQDSTITTKLNIKKIHGTAGQQSAEVGSTEENKLYPYKTTDGVTLELSFEAREKLIQMQTVLHNAGVAKQQGEAMEEAAEDMGKVFTIFRRIANGDIVPPQDEKKLMEYSMEMYQMAKTAAMAAKNDDPKEYDSVDKEEEETGSTSSAEGSSTISATVEIPVSQASGGEASSEAAK